MKEYTKEFPDLKIEKEERLPYIGQPELEDQIYLLKKV